MFITRLHVFASSFYSVFVCVYVNWTCVLYACALFPCFCVRTLLLGCARRNGTCVLYSCAYACVQIRKCVRCNGGFVPSLCAHACVHTCICASQWYMCMCAPCLAGWMGARSGACLKLQEDKANPERDDHRHGVTRGCGHPLDGVGLLLGHHAAFVLHFKGCVFTKVWPEACKYDLDTRLSAESPSTRPGQPCYMSRAGRCWHHVGCMMLASCRVQADVGIIGKRAPYWCDSKSFKMTSTALLQLKMRVIR